MKFIRQEGGKGRFTAAANLLQPWDWDVLVEPFAGSAAVTLAFKEQFPEKDYLLSDIHSEIVNAFTQLRDDLAGVTEWAEHYEGDLLSEATGRELWGLCVKAANQPSGFSKSQRAALRFYAGLVGQWRSRVWTKESGFSPTRAGFRKNERWRRLASDQIQNFDPLHQLMQGVQIRQADYRAVLAEFTNHRNGRTPFIFLDPPYRATTEGRATDSLYYGVEFDLSEFGTVCQRLADAGNNVLVTLDACEQNLDLLGPDWTVLKAKWRSYGTANSHHMVFLNYEPLMPVEETATIMEWQVYVPNGMPLEVA